MDRYSHSITFSTIQVAETSAIILALNLDLSALQHVLTTLPLRHTHIKPTKKPSTVVLC